MRPSLARLGWAALALLATICVSIEPDTISHRDLHQASSNPTGPARSPISLLQEAASTSVNANRGDSVKLINNLEPLTPTTGALGEPGAQGPVGSPGAPGPRGLVGARGPPGVRPSEQGPPGEKGPQGEQGDSGAQGQRGLPGKRGMQGKPGNPGKDGLPSTERGPPGERGEPGLPGMQGRVGPQGPTGGSGATGGVGLNGEKGDKGLPGSPGSQGARGPNGAPGNQGERGQQGPEGPLGTMGAAGGEGKQGAVGVRGPAGESGPAGKAGAHGVEGKRGLQGPDGLPGADGARGERGVPGTEGKAGRRGDSGATGAEGAPGKQGPRGKHGGAGPDGPAGPVGEPGSAGAIGQPGERGPTGNILEYKATGPFAFAVGGSGDVGQMFSHSGGLSLEHSSVPTQIKFVQTRKKPNHSTLPGLIGGYFGNLGIGTETPYARLHVRDSCMSPMDAACASRQGQIMLESPFRNALMAQVQTSYYDLIGSYPLWNTAASTIYIGAWDKSASPKTKEPTKVYFGGVAAGKVMVKPRVKIDFNDGRVYAQKFTTQRDSARVEQVLSDVDSFLSLEESSKDISDSILALHAKTNRHDKALQQMMKQANELSKLMDSY